MSPLPPQYGLVFDAGSTHTALYIYRWPVDKENGTGIVSQVEACTVSGECAHMCLSLGKEFDCQLPQFLEPVVVHQLTAWDAGCAEFAPSPMQLLP